MKKKIFYFTDNLNLTQSLGNSFGPELSDPQNVFNVTSIQNATETVNAVSVCSGVLIAINNAELTNCVNLILMPSEQPETELPYVKYYIYRGVKRESLFDNGVMASAANNDLSASIWATQAVINGEYDKSNDNPIGTTNTPPVSNALEYEITIETDLNTPIYKLFNSFNNGEHQPPTVKGGWTLGEFNSENIGFEIFIEQIGYDLVLSDLCLNKNQIIAPSLGSSPSDLDRFNHWLEKEKILSYLSPCAFFGSFFNSKLYIKGNNTPFTGNNLISSFLKEHFIDANTVYIDIKNEHEYSYDFSRYYKGFDSAIQQASILINTNPTENNVNDFQLVDYSNHNNYNWPLLTLSSADFPLQAGNEKLKLDLSFPKMDLLNRILVVKQGELEIKRKKRSKKQAGNYTFPVFEPNAISCNPISFNLGNISSSSIDIVPSFLRLCYAKEAPQCPANLNQSNGNLELKNVHDLDNVFTPFSMTFPWNISDTEEPESPLSWLYHNEQYVDVMRTSGCSFIGKSGIAKDPNGDVTLFSFPVRKVLGANKVQETPFSLTGRVDKVGNTSFLKSLSRNYNIPIGNIPLGSDGEISYFGNLSSSSINSFDNLTSEDFAYLRILKSDYESIEDSFNLTDFLQNSKVHLALKHIESNVEIDPEPISTSPKNRRTLTKFELVLIGYIFDVDSNLITLETIETGVFTFRIKKTITEKIAYELGQAAAPTYLSPEVYLKPKHYKILNSNDVFTVQNDPIKQFVYPQSTNFSSINVKKREIKCDIYLYRDDNISPEDFCAYKTYFHENIQKIWNSQSNLGLGAVYNPNPNVICEGTVARNYWIDSSQVVVHEATNRHLQHLNKNEVLFIVALNEVNGPSELLPNPEGQSSVHGKNNNTGVMIFDGTVINGIYEPQLHHPNVPAHEFGHVLGLVDYYSYIGLVYNSTASLEKNPIQQNKFLRYLKNATSWVSIEEDSEYTCRYNWNNNLMSTLKHIGYNWGGDNPYQDSFTYNRYLEPYVEALEQSNSNEFISIFITSNQLEDICNYNKQNDKYNWLFFKQMTAVQGSDTVKKHSIVGIYSGSGSENGTLVSDIPLNADSNTGWSNTSDKMEKRIRNANDLLFPESLNGYYSPRRGNLIHKKISTIYPVYDSFDNIVKSKPNEITLTDLITNGNSFNSFASTMIRHLRNQGNTRPQHISDYKLNQIISDMIKIHDDFFIGIRNTAVLPYPSNRLPLLNDIIDALVNGDKIEGELTLNKIIDLYTSYGTAKNVLLDKTNLQNNKYNSFGIGDDYGRDVWNSFNQIDGGGTSHIIKKSYGINGIQIPDLNGENSRFKVIEVLYNLNRLHRIGSDQSWPTDVQAAYDGGNQSIMKWTGLGNFVLNFNFYYNRETIIELF